MAESWWSELKVNDWVFAVERLVKWISTGDLYLVRAAPVVAFADGEPMVASPREGIVSRLNSSHFRTYEEALAEIKKVKESLAETKTLKRANDESLAVQ